MNGEKIHALFSVINVDNIKTINAASPPEKKQQQHQHFHKTEQVKKTTAIHLSNYLFFLIH